MRFLVSYLLSWFEFASLSNNIVCKLSSQHHSGGIFSSGVFRILEFRSPLVCAISFIFSHHSSAFFVQVYLEFLTLDLC